MKTNKLIYRQTIVLALACIITVASPYYSYASGQDSTKRNTKTVPKTDDRFDFHLQTTYIYQYKPAFRALYSGINSMNNVEEKENSATITMYFGLRLWHNAQLYINPEIAGGNGLSGAYGMAASTNGETFRVGDPSPTLYLARAFIVQTFPIGCDSTYIDENANELGGYEPTNYFRIIVGKYSIGDYLDNNSYSNSPRTQFINWALMNNSAWDYAANLRGYTYSISAMLQLQNMNYKLSLATLPKEANGQKLNTNLSKSIAINGEVTKSYKISNHKGNIRLLGYLNMAGMGNYRDAINMSVDTPDVTLTRQDKRIKVGFGINIDQQLNDILGLFARIGWNDGHNETWCFTEADRTISAGLELNGAKWHRPSDNFGVAFVTNGLSKDHKQYLADGGYGFEIGDGKLNYGYETVGEVYYSLKPVSTCIWLSGDYQFALNPGYNKDRGPVNVLSFRVHVEL